MRTRAFRRDRLEHRKRRVINFYGGYMKQLPPEQQARHVGLHATTRKTCSCSMCGNPRRHWGEKTRQETWFELREYRTLVPMVLQ